MVGPGAGADLCSRNGVALPGGGCRCDAAWAGGECGTLNLLPALANNLGTIYPGPDSHSTSSWGGTVSKGEDGLFHLLVSEMLGGCGLGAWQRNSAVRHATSPTIDGVRKTFSAYHLPRRLQAAARYPTHQWYKTTYHT